jgi:phosphate transport system protein
MAGEDNRSFLERIVFGKGKSGMSGKDKGSAHTDSDHIVKAYDEELKRLEKLILKMGGIAESQLGDALRVIERPDPDLAKQVIAADRQLDELEFEVGDAVTKLLALRQPLALDLRSVLVALKMSSDLERVGDYTKNIAKRMLALSEARHSVGVAGGLVRMGMLAQENVRMVLDAYARREVERAIEVWQRDAEVDRYYNSVFREILTYMMEDPRTITAGTHLMFTAKNIERIGDLATNMAENVYYLITGKMVDDTMRPKADDTSSYRGQDDGGQDKP